MKNNLTSLYLFLLILFCGCRSFQNKTSQQKDVIVYRVFDSLEDILCKKMARSHCKDSLGILIEPAGDFSWHLDKAKEGVYVYNIYVYEMSHSAYSSSMLYESNRQMQICGHLYPIYFVHFDDVFRQDGKFRNLPYSHGYLSLNIDIAVLPFLVVDMAKKKVLQDTDPN